MAVLTDGAGRYCGYMLPDQTTNQIILQNFILMLLKSLVGVLLIWSQTWALKMEQWQLFKLSSETIPTAIDTHHRPVINELRHGRTQRTIDLASELDMECLWFCFAELIQKVLNEIKEHWNTHYIRKSRHDTVSGRPDSLYYLPHCHGGGNHFIMPIPEAEIHYARAHVIDLQDDNIHQDYFNYALQACNQSAFKGSHILI